MRGTGGPLGPHPSAKVGEWRTNCCVYVVAVLDTVKWTKGVFERLMLLLDIPMDACATNQKGVRWDTIPKHWLESV